MRKKKKAQLRASSKYNIYFSARSQLDIHTSDLHQVTHNVAVFLLGGMKQDKPVIAIVHPTAAVNAKRAVPAIPVKNRQYGCNLSFVHPECIDRNILHR